MSQAKSASLGRSGPYGPPHRPDHVYILKHGIAYKYIHLDDISLPAVVLGANREITV